MDVFYKQPSEAFAISLDFTNTLSTTETISSYIVVAILAGAVVTSTVIASSTNTTKTVLIRVQAGTTDCNYKITTMIVTSLGNIFEHDIMMKVHEI